MLNTEVVGTAMSYFMKLFLDIQGYVTDQTYIFLNGTPYILLHFLMLRKILNIFHL